MTTQTLRSHNPVSFTLPNGTVKANALTLRSKESVLVFRGNVAVTLASPPQAEQAAAPAAPAASSP
jgi:lipopolysaccharide export system protein LptC